MKNLDAYLIPTDASGAKMLLSEGEASKTFLAFSKEFQRFVAYKLYNRDPYPDARALRVVDDRVNQLRSLYTSGLAFPLEIGEEDHRLIQVTELLPGHALQMLVERNGPLPAPAVLEIARKVTKTVETAMRNYEVKPSLAPNHVFAWGTSGPDWKIGMADYDLRPLSEGEEAPGELQTVQELSLLFYFLGTGDLQTWFYPMLNADLSAEQHPNLDPELLAFYHRLFDGKASQRPFALLDMSRLLVETSQRIGGKPELPEMAVDRPFLSWLPGRGSFPEPYTPKGRLAEIAQPCCFEAVDKLRDSTSLVHILPPDGMTESAFVEEYRQSIQIAQGKTSPLLTPVETVMCDPRCRVVAERPIAGISLSALLEKRVLPQQHGITILEKIDAGLKQLSKEGFEQVSLRPSDIFLVPEGAKSRRSVMSQKNHTWLDQGGQFQVYFRLFHANLFYSEALNLESLNGATGKFGQSSSVLNIFRPSYEFLTLAYALLNSGESPMPKPMADIFRSAFASRPDGRRDKLIASFRRQLGGKKQVSQPTRSLPAAPITPVIQVTKPASRRETKPEAPSRQVPLSALAAMAVLVLGVLAFLFTPAQQLLIAAGKSNTSVDPDGTVKIVMEPVATPTVAPVIDSPPITVSEPLETPEKPLAAETPEIAESADEMKEPETAPEIIVMEEVETPGPLDAADLTSIPEPAITVAPPSLGSRPGPETVAAVLPDPNQAPGPLAMESSTPASSEADLSTEEEPDLTIAMVTPPPRIEPAPPAPAVRELPELEMEPAPTVSITPDPEPAAEVPAADVPDMEPTTMVEEAEAPGLAPTLEPVELMPTETTLDSTPEAPATEVAATEQIGSPTVTSLRATPILQVDQLVTIPSVADETATRIAPSIGRSTDAVNESQIGSTGPNFAEDQIETDVRPMASQPTESAPSIGESVNLDPAMASALDRVREMRAKGDLATASQNLSELLENFADEPAVNAELDSLMSSIRNEQHRLSPREKEQARGLVELAAIHQHYGAVSLLANWADEADSPTAVPWNERAAQQGDADAMARLGVYYSVGKHVEASPGTAVKWFERASKLDQMDALYYLGECYFFGKGVERDPGRAVALLDRAHEQGDAKASDMLATCFAKGEGVASNHQRARELYEESIRRGNKTAFGNLGVLYLQDQGIERDEGKAFELFKKGAQSNAPNAMVLFALSHERGVGTSKNLDLARQWYVKAAKQGHPAAIQWCNTRQIDF